MRISVRTRILRVDALTIMTRLPALLLAAAVLAPLPAAAAPGWAVCLALETGGQGRMVHTAQPYARDSARAEGDAAAFERAAGTEGGAAVTPACHWEPTRDKAADYLRRLKEGSARKAADARVVAFAPAN